jgi:hypothetical protein
MPPPAAASAKDPAERRAGTGLLAAAVVVALLFVASMLAATQGRFVPQVVDLYLTCQYARAMAEGHPFRYNAGDAPSSGATSLLHTGMLAAAHAAGFRGEGLVAFAILTGAGLYVATVWMARDIGARLGDARDGLLAGALVVVGGPVVWGFLYGADVALFMFVATWLLRSLLVAWPSGRFDAAVAPGVLLALTRPEAIVLLLCLALGWGRGPGRGARGARWAAPWIPVAAAVLVLVNTRVVTGGWIGSSLADKSLVANVGVAGAIGVAAEYAVDVVRGLLLGFYPGSAGMGFSRGWASLYFPPLGLVLVLAAALRADALGAPLRLWLVAAAAVFAAVSPNMFLGVHFHRHILWAFPSLLALAAAGAGAVARAAGPGRSRALFRAITLVAVGLGVLSTARFATIYGDMAGEIARRELPLARWIAASLPPGTAMANAATSVEYLTGHRSLNLHGVTTAAFFGTRATERDAGMLEGLGRLAVAERPPYLITSVAAQEASAVLREIVQGPPLYRTTSFADELEVYRTRYDSLAAAAHAHRPDTLRATAGRSEVDRMNVCDPADEKSHGYVSSSRLGGLALGGSARVDQYADGPRVADAGRAILGWERFSVRTAPGRELVIVLRTAGVVSVVVAPAGRPTSQPLDFVEAELEVSVDGRPAGRLRFRPAPGWDEVVLRVPAALVTGERTRLELAGHYASYRYWFFQ